MSSVSLKVTSKLDSWFLDKNVVQSLGFHESPHFGTESTKFYLRAVKGDHNYSLHLYLAACKEEKIHIDGKVVLGPQNPPIYKHLKKGAEITFEETDVAAAKVTQQKHYEALSSQLLNFRLDTKSADITLVTTVDGQEFPAHKWILTLRSTVFAAMFQNQEYKENQTNRVKIDDVTGDVMDTLLKYIYSADIQGVEKIADDLLQAADKYDIPLLVEVCVQLLLTNLTIDTAAKFFYLTDLYRLEDAKKTVLNFIAKNRQAVRNSAGWKQYIGPEQIQQLYDSML